MALAAGWRTHAKVNFAAVVELASAGRAMAQAFRHQHRKPARHQPRRQPLRFLLRRVNQAMLSSESVASTAMLAAVPVPTWTEMLPD